MSEPISEMFNVDCLEYMKKIPKNFFDLAIVDPPYGIKESAHRNISRSKLAKTRNYRKEFWDCEIPPPEYFKELKRISVNQIIWGGNYFLDYLGATRCFIVWDKLNGENDFADCELAWTSFETSVRKFQFRWAGMLQENMKNKEYRIHPTQKPKELYIWTLKKYAKKGDKIFSSHVGSQSDRIAAHELGFDFYGCEIDKHYFDEGNIRFAKYLEQPKLFTPDQPKLKQEDLF